MINFSQILFEAYGFKKTPIYVSELDYNESRNIQKNTPFKNAGIAQFVTNITLWRVIDENELNFILKSKKITGGEYSISIEKKYGASYSGSRDDVINWGRKSTNRLKGQLFVIGINAEDKRFFNLNMVERFEEQGLEYGIGDFTIDTSLGNTGLGFSVKANSSDIYHVLKLNDGGHFEDITDDIWSKLK
jgi:hypothetical protein